jgi:hypothetical protein
VFGRNPDLIGSTAFARKLDPVETCNLRQEGNALGSGVFIHSINFERRLFPWTEDVRHHIQALLLHFDIDEVVRLKIEEVDVDFAFSERQGAASSLEVKKLSLFPQWLGWRGRDLLGRGRGAWRPGSRPRLPGRLGAFREDQHTQNGSQRQDSAHQSGGLH